MNLEQKREDEAPASGSGWGPKLFLAVFAAVLLFFWWLLIYSGGAAVSHG